jgi:LmbE family N-acetylglucosaminyl deacetylase
MSTPLTLMAVHAHPDDESSSTGGVLARYADEGVRTVVVTCTNGELGDAPGGIKPGEEGHDEAEVARIRRGELERACETLGVAHLEMLGYHDSGMVDWEYKDRPDVFCNVAVADAAERLSRLFEKYQPDVVVTYDELGGYDHPDHVHASRVTMAAVAQQGIPQRPASPAFRRSTFAKFEPSSRSKAPTSRSSAARSERVRMMGGRSTYHDRGRHQWVCGKAHRDAAARTRGQMQESFWARFPPRAFDVLFGEEAFIRGHDTTGASTPETDLFVGLR